MLFNPIVFRVWGEGNYDPVRKVHRARVCNHSAGVTLPYNNGYYHAIGRGAVTKDGIAFQENVITSPAKVLRKHHFSYSLHQHLLMLSTQENNPMLNTVRLRPK